MRYAERFTSTPDGWEQPGQDLLGHAQETAMTALKDERVVERLAAYSSRGGNFAGATFINVGPQEPYAFNEADLLALTLLKVAVGPAGVRRLLEPSRTRGRLIDLLGERHLPVDADLNRVVRIDSRLQLFHPICLHIDRTLLLQPFGQRLASPERDEKMTLRYY